MEEHEFGAIVFLPPLQHVVHAHVVRVAERDETGHPDAQPGEASQERDADAVRLNRHAHVPGKRRPLDHSGGQIDAFLGVGEPKRARPQQAHAMPAALGEQLLGLRRLEARGENDKGTHSGLTALASGFRDGLRGDGEHRQVGNVRQRGDSRVTRRPFDGVSTWIDCVQFPGESRSTQIAQDGTSHRAGRASCTYDHHRPGLQQRPEPGHGGGAVTQFRRPPVAFRRVQSHAPTDTFGFLAAFGGQAEPGEDVGHDVVAGSRVRGERRDALSTCHARQMFQKKALDAPPGELVHDREFDPRHGGIVTDAEHGGADHAFTTQCEHGERTAAG